MLEVTQRLLGPSTIAGIRRLETKKSSFALTEGFYLPGPGCISVTSASLGSRSEALWHRTTPFRLLPNYFVAFKLSMEAHPASLLHNFCFLYTCSGWLSVCRNSNHVGATTMISAFRRESWKHSFTLPHNHATISLLSCRDILDSLTPFFLKSSACCG